MPAQPCQQLPGLEGACSEHPSGVVPCTVMTSSPAALGDCSSLLLSREGALVRCSHFWVKAAGTEGCSTLCSEPVSWAQLARVPWVTAPVY